MINKNLAKKCGLRTALLLADFITKHDQVEKTNSFIENEGRKYFFYKSESIEESTTLSYKIQKACIKKLNDLNIVYTIKMGIPCKSYYSIDEDKILELFDIMGKTSIAQWEEQYMPNGKNSICPKVKTYIKKDIIKNDINKKKELKENEFSSESLKSFWNDTCKSFVKCHRINADSYNKLMTQMKKNSITTDDLKKAMLILESLDIDNHFKGGNDRGWKASITWLMQNTKGCIVRLLDGEMSYSRTEKESYKRIINSNDLEVDKNYIPRTGTNLLQDEDGVYRTHEKPNRETIYDGYTNDNRPSMTLIRFLNDTYFWNVGTKTWYKQEKD